MSSSCTARSAGTLRKKKEVLEKKKKEKIACRQIHV
jgi:hypothetical protein